MCFKLLKSLVYNNRITYITTWKLYGGPQVQSENLSNPVQKNKYQHKNIYFSTKVFISVPKNIFQSKNIYFSTKIYISIQKYLFQYKKKFSKYKHIPSVFASRRQKRRMADLNGYSKRSNHLLFYKITNINLSLAECEVRTASYGPSFSLPFMAQARSARAMKTRKEKTRIHNLLYGPSKRG